MALVRFYALIIKMAFLLAMLGQLRSCTMQLMTATAEKSEQGMISYSKFSRLLTK